jgi:hypothetical protein
VNYIGWDWASGSHHVTMIDAAGGIVDRWAFTHTEAGLLAAVPYHPAQHAAAHRHTAA